MRKILLLLGLLVMVSCSDKEGEKLPEFEQKTLAGNLLTQNDLKGKITVINIWATWCKPCIEEIPQLNNLVVQYKQNPEVVFLAVTDDKASKIESFLSKKDFKYQHITDADELIKKLQGGFISTRPQHIVIDRDLTIVYDAVGASSSVGQNIKTKIDKLLN